MLLEQAMQRMKQISAFPELAISFFCLAQGLGQTVFLEGGYFWMSKCPFELLSIPVSAVPTGSNLQQYSRYEPLHK
jgi:hypothetical protein